MEFIFRSIYNLTIDYYHRYLYSGHPYAKRALSYLYSRGFTDTTIKNFKLGFCPLPQNETSQLYNLLRQSGFTAREIILSGIISAVDSLILASSPTIDKTTSRNYKKLFKNNLDKIKFKSDSSDSYLYENFHGMVIIPVIHNNECVWITARYVGDDWKDFLAMSPHMHLRGSKIRWALNHDTLYTRPKSYIVITESPSDCMTLWQNNIKSMAIFGINNAGNIDLSPLIKFKLVLICFDSDPNLAGINGAYRFAYNLYKKYTIRPYIIELPYSGEKVDINEYFRVHNRDDFRQLIKESIDFLETEYFHNIEKEQELIENRRKESRNYKFGQLYQYPLKTIAEEFIELKKTGGGKFKSKCPFHEETKSSFYIYPNESFFCFGCKASGGTIEFIRKYYEIYYNKILTIEEIEAVIKNIIK